MYNKVEEKSNSDEISLIEGDYSQKPQKFNKYKRVEFFSWLFLDILNFTNLTFSAFLIFYYIFSIFTLLLDNEFSNNSLEINLNKWNCTFSNLLILCLIITGYLTTKKKSSLILLLYITILILINFNFLLRQNNVEANKSEINQNSQSSIVNNILTIFYSLIIITTDLLISSYSLYINLLSSGYFKINIINYPFTEIIHELKMKGDTLKMGFNNFVMGLGLHKYLPGILYKLNDYHFNNCTCEVKKEITEINKNLQHNTQNCHKSIISQCRKQNLNITNDSSNLHSKSTIDCDY
jgi:hypothetical protein